MQTLPDPQHTCGQNPTEGRTHSGEAGPSPLLNELRDHLPFSVAAVAIGLIVAGGICILGFTGQETSPMPPGSDLPADLHGHGLEGRDDPARLFFHLFHPAHMLFSAVATAAMFCRYERKIAKAVLIGLIGAIGICGISDIVMPHLSLLLLGQKPEWHICVFEHADLVLPFAAIGVVVAVAASGGVVRSTIISHSLHVFASTMATIFYMVGPLGLIAWIGSLGKVFIFVVLAVMVPCCLSDIVFPMLMSRSGREQLLHDSHVHP